MTPPTVAELLQRFVEILVEANSGELLAVGFTLDPTHGDEIELALRPIGHVDQLIGFTAPEPWWAFGIVAPATARRLDRPSARPERIRIAYVVGRGGESASAMRPELTRAVSGAPRRPDAPEGIVPDLCRRVLGLTTPGPDSNPALLLDAVWLDAIAAHVLSRDLGATPPAWGQIAWIHPAAPPGPAPDAVRLARLARRTASTTRWEDLRRLCARGELTVPGVAAGDAAWMDEGLFARYSLRTLPPQDELLADLAELLGDELAAQITACLAAPRPTLREVS